MGRLKYAGARREDLPGIAIQASPVKLKFLYPLNVGSLIDVGHTPITILEGNYLWRIKKGNFVLDPQNLPEYPAWEDTGWESVVYSPHERLDGWEHVPDWARKVDIYSVQKKVKVIYKCIFTGNGNLMEIEKSL